MEKEKEEKKQIKTVEKVTNNKVKNKTSSPKKGEVTKATSQKEKESTSKKKSTGKKTSTTKKSEQTKTKVSSKSTSKVNQQKTRKPATASTNKTAGKDKITKVNSNQKNNTAKKESPKKETSKKNPTTKNSNKTEKKPPNKNTPAKKTTTKKEQPIKKKEENIDLEKTQILSTQDLKIYEKSIQNLSPKTTQTPKEDHSLEHTFGHTIILNNVDVTNQEKVEDAIADIFSETGKIDLDSIKYQVNLDPPIISPVQKKIDIRWLVTLLITLICLIFIIHHFITFDHNKVIIKKETPKIINENYVFFGDSLTHRYDLKKYFEGYPVVNSGVDGYKTSDLLNKIDKMVFEYNPSKVFILIGTNDIEIKKSDEEIVNNIQKMIKEIKENRPHSKIYIESLYPVDSTRTKNRSNTTIKNVNEKLKELCESENIEYIDIHKLLADKEGNLKEEYSDDGLHMNENAYRVITDKLIKYIKK